MEKIRLRQARLNQFLDVVNANFKEMTDPDKYALAARFRFSAPMSLFGKRQNGEQHWKSVIKLLPRVQHLFRGAIEKFMKLKEGELLPLPPLKRVMQLEDGQFKIIYDSKTRAISYGKAPLEDMLLFDIADLADLLDGVSQSAFRICPECHKLFLQIAKKVKLYDTPVCAFKFLSRQRRERLKKKAT